MAEYIEREAIKNLININFSGLLAAIDTIPVADVAPVVHCRECEHSYEDVCGRFCNYGVCVDCEVSDDFFCSYGERRKEQKD